jgi:Ca2+/Na+ antiporter
MEVKVVKNKKLALTVFMLLVFSLVFFFIPNEQYLYLLIAAVLSVAVFFLLVIFFFKCKEAVSLKNNNFKFKVDYNVSLKKLAKKGKFMSVSGIINSYNFPVKKKKGRRKMEAFLYKPEEPTLVSDIIEKGVRENPDFRPATLFETMWFLLSYPKVLDDNIVLSLSKTYEFNSKKYWPFFSKDVADIIEVDAYIFGIISTKELVLFVKD